MAPAAAERIALVIGNGAYQSAGARLANPPNDAEAIAAELNAAVLVKGGHLAGETDGSGAAGAAADLLWQP